MGMSAPRIGPALAVSVLALALVGCADRETDAGDGPPTERTSPRGSSSSTSSTSTKRSTSSSTAPTSPSATPSPSSASSTSRSTSTSTTSTPPPTSTTSTTPAAATGPRQCGAVTSVPGTPVTVRIVAGEVTCSDAEELLSTYYREVPTRGQGSGGHLRLEEWDCITSSAASFASTGLATTCTTAAGAQIVTEGDPGTDGSSCAEIDAATLEQMFPDGRLDEQLCRNYAQGE